MTKLHKVLYYLLYERKTNNTSLMSTPNAKVRRTSPIAVSCEIWFKLYFVLKTCHILHYFKMTKYLNTSSNSVS